MTCICTLQVEISRAPRGPDGADLWFSSLAVPAWPRRCGNAGMPTWVRHRPHHAAGQVR